MSEPWRSIKVGDRVQVSEPVGLDRCYRGIRGVVIRFTQPHGFAAIRTAAGNEYLIHPESLRATEV